MNNERNTNVYDKEGDMDLGTVVNPATVTKENILDYIVECGKLLDEYNVPEQGRWLYLREYDPPRSKKWRLHKKRMKEAWWGMCKRDMMRKHI